MKGDASRGTAKEFPLELADLKHDPRILAEWLAYGHKCYLATLPLDPIVGLGDNRISTVYWIRRFILYVDKRHPRDLGAAQVEAFVTHLAVQGRVAESTQNKTKSAILFLCRKVPGQELPWLSNVVRAKQPQRLPAALT